MTGPWYATDVSAVVRDWYARSEWGPQGKDIGWADYILIDGGRLLLGKDVLNLGCYYPEDELRFARHAKTWTAIDFTPEVIDRAQALCRDAIFQVGDMRELDFSPEQFDVVLDFSSGDHLTDEGYRQTALEVHRVLRPGGYFVCVFLNRLAMVEHGLWVAGQTEEWGRFGYSRGNTGAEMRTILTDAGFVVEREANQHLPRSGLLARRPGGGRPR